MGNSPSKNEPLPKSSSSSSSNEGNSGSSSAANGGSTDLDPDDIAPALSNLNIHTLHNNYRSRHDYNYNSDGKVQTLPHSRATPSSEKSKHATSPAINIDSSSVSSSKKGYSNFNLKNDDLWSNDDEIVAPSTRCNSQSKSRLNEREEDVLSSYDMEIGMSMAELLKSQQQQQQHHHHHHHQQHHQHHHHHQLYQNQLQHQQQLDAPSSVESSELSASSPAFTTMGLDTKDSDSLSSINSSPGGSSIINAKNIPVMDSQDGLFSKLDSIAEHSPSLETSPEPIVKSIDTGNSHAKVDVKHVKKLLTGRSSSSISTATIADSPPLQPSSKKYDVDIDGIIERLLATKKRHSSRKSKSVLDVDTNEIKFILGKSRSIFLEQPSLLRLSPPVKIVGDIHGQFHDLVRIFNCCGYPPHSNYLFLGDYVDRGEKSLETILLLLCYKIKYPENFFMLRGNHESANITKIYGFYDECKRRLKVPKLWKSFVDVFNSLPIAATINDKIFCVHGGLSPEMNTFKQIEDIKRPTDVPDRGLLADLLWSDPDASVKNFSLTNWPKNDRGVSYCFGKRHVDYFCSKFKLDLIVRGHMVVEDGYEFFNKRKLVTVFSAPNYCGEFNNFGAIMSVDQSLYCSFELIKPS